MAAKQFTLGKKERLKSRKRIERLFKGGKNLNVYPFRIFYLFNEPVTGTAGVYFGAGASVRNFKKAVDRNRIKRLTREAWRLQKNELQQKILSENKSLDLFCIYTARELPEQHIIADKMVAVLKKLIKRCDEENPSAA